MEKHTYPLLGELADVYREADLGNVLLLACQHLLEPQLMMFKTLITLGLKPHNCIVVGKNYSANAGVMQELRDLGCIVAPWSLDFDPHQAFDVWFEERITAFTTEQLRGRNLQEYSKVMILDDGGFMHTTVHKLVGDDVANIVGVEQTTSGAHRIKAAGIKFPLYSVAQSYHKLMRESTFIGANVAEYVQGHLAARDLLDSKILVMGIGAIGAMVAGHLHLNKRISVHTTDSNLNPHGRRNVSAGARELLALTGNMMELGQAFERIAEFEVIIGTTGTNILAESYIQRLNPHVTLISSSSSDREFPATMFRHGGGGVHDDYMLGDRCLVNGGFPINFNGERNAMPPQQIEYTMCVLMTYMMCSLHPGGTYLASLILERIRIMWQPLEGAAEWYRDEFKPVTFNQNRAA